MPAIRDWSHVDVQADPLVELADIEIDESTTVHLVRGHPAGREPIVYNGETYIHTNWQMEEQEQTIEGSFPNVEFRVSNIDGVAGGLIEQNDLEGNSVTLTYVPLSALRAGGLGAGDYLTETYKIQDQSYERQVAVLVLGFPDIMDRIVPWAAFVRGKCRWNYARRFEEDSGCFYPSDYFEGDTQQDYLVGTLAAAEKAFQHGWFAINRDKADELNANISVPGSLYLEVSQTAEWLSANRDGPFAYKKIDGDFDVWCEVSDYSNGANTRAGLLIQDVGDPTKYVLWGVIQASDTDPAKWRIQSMKDGATSSPTADLSTAYKYLRIERRGNSIDCYYSNQPNAGWILHQTETSTFGTTTRIGLVFSRQSGASGANSADFGFMRFRAGGLSTCSRVDLGPNGCLEHANIAHFGAFRSIPGR